MKNRSDLQARVAFEHRLQRKLDDARTETRVLRLALRDITDYLGAEHGEMALHDRVRDAFDMVFYGTGAAPMPQELLRAFLRNERPAYPRNLLLAPLRRKKHILGVVGFRRAAGFSRGEGRFLVHLASRVALEVARRRAERVAAEVARIHRYVCESRSPRDLLYQILHALARLTRYDRAAAILRVEEGRLVTVAARTEQGGINLAPRQTFLVERSTSVCRDPSALADLLQVPRTSLVASAVTQRGRVLGVLCVLAHREHAFTGETASILERFAPAAAWALEALDRDGPRWGGPTTTGDEPPECRTWPAPSPSQGAESL
ncbi:MAG: GAF domain-containing protein [Planctomycetota bacterium]